MKRSSQLALQSNFPAIGVSVTIVYVACTIISEAYSLLKPYNLKVSALRPSIEPIQPNVAVRSDYILDAIHNDTHQHLVVVLLTAYR